VGDIGPSPERQLEAGIEIEKRDGAMFELSADNAFGLEIEAIAVKGDGAGEIIDAKGEDGNAGFHGSTGN
jgi:hypothetical protein